MVPGWLIHHKSVALVLALLALVASFLPGWHRVEQEALSVFQRTLPERVVDSGIVVVGIDASSLELRGDWPWPRDRLAAMINKIDRAGAMAVGLTLDLGRPQPLPDAFDITAGQQASDQLLAEAMLGSGKVVIASSGTDDSQAGIALVESAQGWAGNTFFRTLLGTPVLPVESDERALPLYLASAAAVGRIWTDPESLQRVSQPLVTVLDDGRALPDFALQLLVTARGLQSVDLEAVQGRAVRVGADEYDTDSAFHVYPWPQLRKGTVHYVAASEVLDGKVGKEVFGGRVVLLGLTAPGVSESVAGPAGLKMSEVEWQARILAALQHPELAIQVPGWAYGVQRLLLLALAAMLIFLPGVLRRPLAMTASLGLAFVMANISLVLLLVESLWLPLAMPALFLVGGHAVLVLREKIASGVEGLLGSAERAWSELAANLQAQGQLDRALDVLMQIRLAPPLFESLYGLGMDFERRRQFAKAIRVYDHIALQAPDFRDISQRRQQLSAMPDTMVKSRSGASTAASTIVMDSDSIARPLIGRYEIERELGHGAMGVVYLGKDPRIGRTVAIKTLSLTDEFEEGQLEEVRRRFYQEAETAGQLHHPNIVTIYDVGEEHDLAYIAMDYIDGDNLKPYVREDSLLPVEEVFEICIQIAEALEFAHRNKVVHRDIKPENIMYDRDNGVLKVMDFGIACLTDNSKTRTGTVLGSPYYMSPEQISGKRVDGRSDLYSLGVMLYQLLTGSLPFQADSLANLMYQITHNSPPSVRKLRRELPGCTVRLLNRALEKDAGDRFANGADMAEALRKCASKYRPENQA